MRLMTKIREKYWNIVYQNYLQLCHTMLSIWNYIYLSILNIWNIQELKDRQLYTGTIIFKTSLFQNFNYTTFVHLVFNFDWNAMIDKNS